jgi:hypothetical protein
MASSGNNPPPGLSPSAVIAAAFAAGVTAIDVLKAAAAGSISLAQTAQADLDKLIVAAGGQPAPHATADPSPEKAVAAAFAAASTAIAVLKTEAAGQSAVSRTAQADLDALITQAGGTPPASKA